MHVVWNQTERFTICYGATNSNKNGELKEIDEQIITGHKNDLDQILLYGNWRYRYDTNNDFIIEY